jgi:hypothetical protein
MRVGADGDIDADNILPAIDLTVAAFVDLPLVDDAVDLNATHDIVGGVLVVGSHLLEQFLVLVGVELEERVVLLDFGGAVVLEEDGVVADETHGLLDHLDAAVAEVVDFERLGSVESLVLEKLLHVADALEAVVHFARLALLPSRQLQLHRPLRELLRHLPEHLAHCPPHEFIIILGGQGVSEGKQRVFLVHEVGAEDAFAVES